MRVGLVVHGTPPELVGGTERLTADLARALAARGDDVCVFSGSIEWRERFTVERHEAGAAGAPFGVPVVRVHRHDLFFERWDKLENPHVERAYLQWLDAFRPQLVHVHHWARLTTTLVRRATERGLPVVLSLHDLFSSCPRYHRVKPDLSFCEVAAEPDACRHCAPRWRFQGDAEIDTQVGAFAADLRAEVAAATEVLAPTVGHGARLLSWLGLTRDVTGLPPASETSLAPASRPLGARVASADDPLRVGTFGHLHALKGAGVLLDAQAALSDPRVVEVHVWGEAPDDASQADLVARAGDRRVVRHGAYTPADLSHADIDVAVVPTLCAESYSFALDEACALGVPVLASDIGALADRATARMELFPGGDAAALAAALQRFAEDPGRRAACCAAPAPPRTGQEAHLAGLEPVYTRALGHPPMGPPAADPDGAAAVSDALARAERLFDLREAGLRELLRSEGWEDVVAGLQAELARRPAPGPPGT